MQTPVRGGCKVEVKRNRDRYRAKRLQEKVGEMQKTVFKGKDIHIGCLSMDDMEMEC